MKLRTKTWLPATIGLAAFSMGGAALAQCNSGCTPPPLPPGPWRAPGLLLWQYAEAGWTPLVAFGLHR